MLVSQSLALATGLDDLSPVSAKAPTARLYCSLGYLALLSAPVRTILPFFIGLI